MNQEDVSLSPQPVPAPGPDNKDLASPPLAPLLYEGHVEGQKQFVAERMRKKYPVAPANEAEYGHDEAQPASPHSEQNLPYADPDDNELEWDEKDNTWVMKKYRDLNP